MPRREGVVRERLERSNLDGDKGRKKKSRMKRQQPERRMKEEETLE